MSLTITISGYDIAVSTDHVVFGPLGIAAQPRVRKPLRSTDGTPTSDGGTTATWQITVTREHASKAAALEYYVGLPGDVAALTDVTLDPVPSLGISGYGDFPNAAIQSATCDLKGVSSVTTWIILTSPTPTPPPTP